MRIGERVGGDQLDRVVGRRAASPPGAWHGRPGTAASQISATTPRPTAGESKARAGCRSTGSSQRREARAAIAAEDPARRVAKAVDGAEGASAARARSATPAATRGATGRRGILGRRGREGLGPRRRGRGNLAMADLIAAAGFAPHCERARAGRFATAGGTKSMTSGTPSSP